MKRLAFVSLIALCGLAQATPVDYASQWPVTAPRVGNGAISITLRDDVYRAIQRRDLGDLDVLDAKGRPQPLIIETPSARSTEATRALDWFAMPAPSTANPSEWRVIADVGRDGSLHVQSGSTSTAAASSTLLMDAHRAIDDAFALDVAWTPGARFDRGYTLEGSDDFDRWRTLGRGRLVDLQQGARRLLRTRIRFDAAGTAPRYLRLVPDDANAAAPTVVGVSLVTAQSAQATPQWIALAPRVGTFEYTLPGRVPLRWIDIDSATPDARAWTLQSRDDADAPWRTRVSNWIAYRVDGGRSPARVFDRALRDREWRLSGAGANDAPRLRVGYVPEHVVFVAGGTPPYTLVAGSAQMRRDDASAAAQDVLRMIRTNGGEPVAATLGAMAERGGDAALKPASNWRAWSLWAVLALGVLVVGAFALRVLREPAATPD